MPRTARAIMTAVLGGLLLTTGTAQATPAHKPDPDQCTTPIYVGDIQLLETRPRPPEGCKARETPAYSPQTQRRLLGWPTWLHGEDRS
ncbi:hypothetical protein AB5J72_47480 [Streptomyces sp. CG1]|uniref:hypothetical protein n=1 Tax=Streptomyces sp. CG1 TaxID=1287523 RepID=UPI0034E2A188